MEQLPSSSIQFIFIQYMPIYAYYVLIKLIAWMSWASFLCNDISWSISAREAAPQAAARRGNFQTMEYGEMNLLLVDICVYVCVLSHYGAAFIFLHNYRLISLCVIARALINRHWEYSWREAFNRKLGTVIIDSLLSELSAWPAAACVHCKHAHTLIPTHLVHNNLCEANKNIAIVSGFRFRWPVFSVCSMCVCGVDHKFVQWFATSNAVAFKYSSYYWQYKVDVKRCPKPMRRIRTIGICLNYSRNTLPSCRNGGWRSVKLTAASGLLMISYRRWWTNIANMFSSHHVSNWSSITTVLICCWILVTSMTPSACFLTHWRWTVIFCTTKICPTAIILMRRNWRHGLKVKRPKI